MTGVILKNHLRRNNEYLFIVLVFLCGFGGLSTFLEGKVFSFHGD